MHIIEIKKDFVIGAAETSETVTVVDRDVDSIGQGIVLRVQLNIPNWTNAVTATFDFMDEDDREIYELSGTLARNDVHNSPLLEGYAPFCGDLKMKVTLSGVPGGSGGTVNAKVYIKQG
jgi:hypothetical protein